MWRTFLANHAHHLWAADLLTVQTLTFKTLYVLVFIAHGRRELMHVNVTANPTAAWVWRQVIEATPWGRKPRHLLRDRDAVYGRDFRARAERIGMDAIATPVRAPRANAVAERVIGTLRRECLDHLIILNEAHLQSVLREFVGYYDAERPHRTLRLETPEPTLRPIEGRVQCRPVLGGLHHVTSERPDHLRSFAPPQAVGLAVTLTCTSSRRPWAMNTNMYSVLNVSVGTVNGSAAQRWWAWLRKNVRQVWLGERAGPRQR